MNTLVYCLSLYYITFIAIITEDGCLQRTLQPLQTTLIGSVAEACVLEEWMSVAIIMFQFPE